MRFAPPLTFSAFRDLSLVKFVGSVKKSDSGIALCLWQVLAYYGWVFFETCPALLGGAVSRERVLVPKRIAGVAFNSPPSGGKQLRLAARKARHPAVSNRA